MTRRSELARTDAVLVECRGYDTLIVTGAERRSWLEGLVTCQVGQLEPGQGTWGLVLNRQGKIQSVLWVVAAAEALWLALAPGTIDQIEPELGRMLIMEDAELARPDAAQRWFTLHGPQAVEKAAALAARFSGQSAALDWTGLGGAALVVAAEHAAAVGEAGREQLLSDEDWLRLRLERGLPEFGTDFDGKDRPHEAALDRRAVSWTKGCYLGQEVVCMQDMRGKVKKSERLFAIAAPAEAQLPVGASLVGGAGQAIGSLTSRAYSERAHAWLALARVDLDLLSATAGDLYCLPGGDVPAGDVRWRAQPSEPV
jgi:folate-binding protein YgfZ